MFLPDFKDRLTTKNSEYYFFIQNLFSLLLKSDNAANDPIIKLLPDRIVNAKIVAKSKGMFVGLEEIAFLIKSNSPLDFKFLLNNGDSFDKNATLITLNGNISEILKLERILLNFIIRIISVATMTKSFVSQLNNFNNHVKLLATRKTLYGLLDKKSASLAGALTHRLNASHAMIVKDTHQVPDLGTLIDALLNNLPINLDFIEVEVENESDARLVLQKIYPIKDKLPFGIMFDNFDPAELSCLLTTLNDERLLTSIFTEASGGIKLENLKNYDIPYLNYVSSSLPTFAPQTVDISLELDNK